MEDMMASDKLMVIEVWLEEMKEALEGENISYGELNQIDTVHSIINREGGL